MLALYLFLIAFAIQASLQAPGAVRQKITSDSPIQLISIRPAAHRPQRPLNRSNRRSPSTTRAPPPIRAEPQQVVNIERLKLDVLRPLTTDAQLTTRSSQAAVRVQSNEPVKPQRKRGAKLEVKPFQRGKWLRFDPGPSPIYYARARANGLFQIDSLRSWASAKSAVSKVQ